MKCAALNSAPSERACGGPAVSSGRSTEDGAVHGQTEESDAPSGACLPPTSTSPSFQEQQEWMCILRRRVCLCVSPAPGIEERQRNGCLVVGCGCPHRTVTETMAFCAPSAAKRSPLAQAGHVARRPGGRRRFQPGLASLVPEGGNNPREGS